MADTDETDRAAILERRRHFIASALGRVESAPIGPRTGVVVVAVASLATACPCLKMSPPTTGEEVDETEDSMDTTGADTAGPDTTGGTGGEETGPSANPEPSAS
jgi:hypothetical protein